jgi:hypothetical protein
MTTRGGETQMKSIFRTLPGLATAFVLGAMLMSPGYEQLPSGVREREIGLALAAGVILTLIAVFVTRGKPQQQNTGFGSPARNRNGR